MYFVIIVEIVSECSCLLECFFYFINILIYCYKFVCLKLNIFGFVFYFYLMWIIWVILKLNSILVFKFVFSF